MTQTTQRSLRTYQQESWDQARSNFAKGFRSILIQGVTGTGKTRMVAHGINTAILRTAPGTSRKQRVWFIVPRKELLWQSSAELTAWEIQHGMISAKSKESAAFNVHVVSRDTLIRLVRKNKIKNWPELMIFDEAHVALKQQLEIKAAAPSTTIILGVTATPERLDNTPLLGMYDVAVFGHQMQWFVENKFLKRPWVLSIPGKDRLQGLSDLKTNAAGDVNANALMELYKERAQGNKVLYGNEIKHYEKHGTGRSFLVFCRNLDQAKEVAEEFTNSGISCEEIDGTMTDKVRREKIKRVESGQIMGLTTVDLCTYGLDVPRISCLILLRLTDSVALFFQMIGRGLRWDGRYENCLILDHVGNCDDTKHGHPLLERTWNFAGTEKKKKKPKDAVEKVEGVDHCKRCHDHIIDKKLPDGRIIRICRGCDLEVEPVERKVMKEIDGWLVEIKEPTPLRERPIENQRHYEDMINNNADVFRAKWAQDGVIDVQAVTNLIQVAHELKRQPMWVYLKLTEGDTMVNVSLLSAIQLIEIPDVKPRYKNGWLYMKRKELEGHKRAG